MGSVSSPPPRYPLLLDISSGKCVVAGGGKVAERKIRGLLEAGAKVTVITPRASDTVQALAYQGRVEWVSRPFRQDDAEGALLIFGATDDAAANRRVLEAAKKYGALCNIADDPEGSDFHLPAIERRGGVTLTVSTEGASPALSAWIRNRLSGALPEGVEKAARLFARLRTNLTDEEKENASELFGKLLTLEIVEDLLAGDNGAIREKVDAIFGKGAFDKTLTLN